MRDTSRLMPPCTASKWPSSDEPTPYGITATPCADASFTASATSAVLSQNTTASGGGTSKGDSSRPCCSRTAAAVEQRSPKHDFKASISADGIARGAKTGRRWVGRGAFIGDLLVRNRNPGF